MIGSLFSDLIFCEDGSVGMGAFRQEHEDGSNLFLMICFQKKSSSDSKDFFHIGMEAWGGEQLFVS